MNLKIKRVRNLFVLFREPALSEVEGWDSMTPTTKSAVCRATGGEGMAMRDYLNNLAVTVVTACPLWIRNNPFSREAAKECSPRRKPWVSLRKRKSSSEGAEETWLIAAPTSFFT